MFHFCSESVACDSTEDDVKASSYLELTGNESTVMESVVEQNESFAEDLSIQVTTEQLNSTKDSLEKFPDSNKVDQLAEETPHTPGDHLNTAPGSSLTDSHHPITVDSSVLEDKEVRKEVNAANHFTVDTGNDKSISASVTNNDSSVRNASHVPLPSGESGVLNSSPSEGLSRDDMSPLADSLACSPAAGSSRSGQESTPSLLSPTADNRAVSSNTISITNGHLLFYSVMRILYFILRL